MKMKSTILLTALLILGVIVTPMQAQNDAPAKSADQTLAARPDDNPPVRIDDTGVHVGGDNPVDINVPGHGVGMGGFVRPLLPIVSIIAVFGMPVAVVGIILYFVYRRNRLLHETLRAMVEKGVPIPPELMSWRGISSAKATGIEPRGMKDLRSGLILIAIGTGMLLIKGMGFVNRLGLIPFFIGVALIVVWLIGMIVNRKKNTTVQ